MPKNTYRETLREIYEERRRANPSYSLARFSKDAGFKSYHMSDVLRGHYGLSPARAGRVANNLKLTSVLKEKLIMLVTAENAKSSLDRESAKKSLQQLSYESDRSLSNDEFKAVSQWYHMAIVELIRKEGFSGSPAEISEKLNIPKTKAKQALESLITAKIIEQSTSGYKINYHFLSTESSTPSNPIREYHRQMLKKSEISLEKDKITERNFLSYNILLTPEEYESLASELAAFLDKKIFTIQNSSKKNARLYALNTQLIPLEEKKKSTSSEEKT